MKHTLAEVEAHFRNEFENWGFIADENSFGMIFGLIEMVKELDEDAKSARASNRHFCHHFFDGDVTKMQETFYYMK